mmetsp:Transcript_25279/g.35655  ORF Transcript_25279/g.35655 Transcript_25279/m.35655 type:complete len:368 (-) Transcript_25279:1240-2343(-)
MKRLPLLDIRKWYSNPGTFAEELRQACHRVGFFTLQHDLPSGLSERMLQETNRFFALSRKTKLSMSYEHSPAFRGYMALGKENTSGKIDFREQLELASETTSNQKLNPHAWPEYYERLRGPNPWPDLDLKQCVHEYVYHLNRISKSLTEALCVALQLERNAFGHLFEDPFWQLKLASVSLPSISCKNDHGEEEIDQEFFGVGAHTDTGFLTLLLQDDIGGLQVYTEGEWIDVPPAGPNIFVCNIGEVAEIASGGYLLATPHRVLLPDAVVERKQSNRLSVPFFYNPTLSAKVDTVGLPNSLCWERDNQQQHWRRKDNSLLKVYGENAFKSLARSHPSIISRHHGDLELLDDGRIVLKEGQFAEQKIV